MSYEDTRCPCGGTKDRDTMLCQVCESDLAGHNSMKVFRNEDGSWNVEARRHAAIILCAESATLGRTRRRKGL